MVRLLGFFFNRCRAHILGLASSRSTLPGLKKTICALALTITPLFATSGASITQPSSDIQAKQGQTISFSGTSTCDAADAADDSYVTYAWNFGDGATANGQSTTHAYSTPGVYTATFTATWKVMIGAMPDYDGNFKSWKTYTYTYSAQRIITILTPPSINAFTASKTYIRQGETITLSWNTENATSLSISGIGTVTGNAINVTPLADTTYTLTASNASGSASAGLSITTYQVSISVSGPTSPLKVGGSATLTASISPWPDAANQGATWKATGGSLNTLGPVVGGVVFYATSPGVFTVTATSVADPSKSSSITIAVETIAISPPAPANPTLIQGDRLAFSAVVSGAMDQRVSWSTDGGGTIDSNGVFTATSAGTWKITATSTAASSKSSSTNVTVTPLSLALKGPSSVPLGGGAQLTPTFNAGTGVITPGDIPVSSGRAVVVTNLSVATTYTLTVTNGPISSSVQWVVGVATKPAAIKWKRDVVYLGAKEVAEIDSAGTHVTLLDHLGSPRYVVGPSGNLESQMKYLPFGELLDQIGAAPLKGFTGHQGTDPSGLVYMGARFYLPAYHRFASPDPGSDQSPSRTQSWNRYSYVRNSPVGTTDPTGMFGIALFGGLTTDDDDTVSGDSGGHGSPSIGDSAGGAKRTGSSTAKSSSAQAQTGVKEYDLSGLTGPDLEKAQQQIRNENPGAPDIQRPAGKDAATFAGVTLDIPAGGTTQPGKTEGSAGTATTAPPQASIAYHFVVYWVSPTTPSKAGEPTLRAHENRHVQANLSVVQGYNSISNSVILTIPAGAGKFMDRVIDQYRGLSARETSALVRQLEAAHAQIDNY